jgi:hypothetical protein
MALMALIAAGEIYDELSFAVAREGFPVVGQGVSS